MAVTIDSASSTTKSFKEEPTGNQGKSFCFKCKEFWTHSMRLYQAMPVLCSTCLVANVPEYMELED